MRSDGIDAKNKDWDIVQAVVPMLVPSLGESRYCVSFINDFSIRTWICFLKKKLEVFENLLEFKVLVENQTDKHIKVLRTNNGGQLCGKEFDQF